MKAWWSTLQARERMILMLGATIGAALLIYLLAWEPLSTRRAELSERIAASRETLIWMRGASQEIRQLRTIASSDAPVRDNRSLLALVDASAKQAGMRDPIQRMEPDGGNGVNLWLENAPFDVLIRWLGELRTQYGIRTEQITIDRGEGNGRIDSRLRLQRQ